MTITCTCLIILKSQAIYYDNKIFETKMPSYSEKHSRLFLLLEYSAIQKQQEKLHATCTNAKTG